MGFFSQCERKHNYFVHVLIRLQVQQAYACINGVKVLCACMHIYALGIQRVKINATMICGTVADCLLFDWQCEKNHCELEYKVQVVN